MVAIYQRLIYNDSRALKGSALLRPALKAFTGDSFEVVYVSWLQVSRASDAVRH